ncbi:MAG: DUF4185 domain-containing protein [Alphaproteobacteria bacterium]|nr:DUF4185 domain-containing protein [Alphaproteobacteria bacterium]
MRTLLLLAPLAACSGAADLSVVDVRELGPMAQPAEIEGRDGGVSGLFQGRSVWVYGDGGATESGTFPNPWRNNSMSWTEDLDASDGLQGFVQPLDALGAADEFFPRTEDEQAFNEVHVDDGDCEDPCGARYAIWGGGPVEDGDRAWLSYAQIYSEPGEWNFHPVGNSLALWTDFDAGPTRPEVASGLSDPTLLFDSAAEGEFGPGLYLQDGFLAMYSCSGGPWEDHGCRLGRAPVERALERDAWQFWDGSAWTDAVTDAASLFRGSPNITIAENPFLGRWLAVYMDWGKVVARTAPAPEGPWSREVTLFEVTEDGAMHAGEHPELRQEEGGIVYISYLADVFYLVEVTLAAP